MKEILTAIQGNLLSISIVLFLIFTFQLANMIFGIINNVVICSEEFCKDKFKKWLGRTLLTIAGIFIMCTGITLIPFCISYINIKIPDEYNILINFALVVSVSIKSLKTEVSRAFENYEKVMENI